MLTLDRLEQKCLGHVISLPREFSGHALTTQGGLMAYAPPIILPGTSWEVPISEVSRLLRQSPQYPGELTPVQIWNRVKEAPGFSDATPEKLQGLIMALSSKVNCNGQAIPFQIKIGLHG